MNVRWWKRALGKCGELGINMYICPLSEKRHLEKANSSIFIINIKI